MTGAFDLDDASWARLRELLDAALSLPRAERPRWLDTLPATDAPLRTRIAGLLAIEDSGSADDLLGTLPRLETLDFAAAAAPADHAAGEVIGPYTLLRPLGEGGMGSVWLAQRADGLIDRPVALKLPRVLTDRGTLAARMARERRILAALSHEHIARLYDAGLAENGQPYLALEYVEGTPIDEFCRARGLGLCARLALFRAVVDAIAYAHGKLVVHRDLKPANVLVTADARVKLLDFGIAKLLDESATGSTELTRFHGRPLTLEFASPEQVRGEDSGTGSDIYSLGVILFHLLAGTRPYRIRRNSRAELEEAILAGEPLRPSVAATDPALRAGLRGDLDTIIGKALRKAPEQRYATANALGEDIDRFLSDRPVLARPDSRAYRLRKFVRRNRAGVAVAASTAALAIAGVAAILWQAHVAIDARRKAEDLQQFIASIFTGADPFERGGAPVSAVTLLERARERVDRELADRPDLRVKLLSTIGNSLANLHAIDAAGRALTEGVEVATRAFGAEAPATLRARVDRLGIAGFLDDPARADAELRAVSSAVRAHDPHDGLLPDLLTIEAVADYEAGNFTAAIDLANAAYAAARRDYPAGDMRTARAAQLQAQTHEFARRFAEAEPLARDAIAQTRAATLDPDSGDLIEARMILVRVLKAEGRSKESLAEYLSVLDSARRHFGDESVEVQFHERNVARELLDAGDPARSATLYADLVRSAAAKEKVDGKHRAAPSIGHAQALLEMRDARGALAEVLPEISRLELAGDGAQPDLVRARLVAARAAALLGQFETGAAQFAALPARVDGPVAGASSLAHVHGEPGESPAIRQARVFAGRAEFEHLRGDDAAAIDWARKALEAAGPGSRTERLRTLPVLGLALVGARQFDAAQRAFDEALSLSGELQLGDSPERAAAWLGIGEIAAARGQCARAREFFERVRGYWRSSSLPPPAPARSGTACAPVRASLTARAAALPARSRSRAR